MSGTSIKQHYYTERDTIGFSLILFYTLTSYISQPPMLSSTISTIFLYLFLGYTLFKLASNLKRFEVRPYTYWYLAFILFSLITYFYAADPDIVLKTIYTLVVVLFLTFAFTYYFNKVEDFIIVLKIYAISGVTLAVIMFAMGLVSYEQRLGQELFGNANAFALVIMISELCMIWLSFYVFTKQRILYIAGSILMFYLLLLSGGRKFILVSLLFLYILMVLKYLRNQKKQLIFNSIAFVAILFAVYYMMFEIKPLYDVVGVRFEGLMSFFSGKGIIDSSTLRRQEMIEFGLNAFSQQPVWGYGLDNFKALFFTERGLYSYAHNNYIEVLVDFGILGFFLYYGYFAYILYELIKIKNDFSGMRNFFIGLMVVLSFYDYGAVTYHIIQIQLLLALAGSYIWIIKRATRQSAGSDSGFR